MGEEGFKGGKGERVEGKKRGREGLRVVKVKGRGRVNDGKV